MKKKAEKLLEWLADKGSVLVAFSGGVDSSVVAKASYFSLGENAIAVTARSSTLSKSEFESAKKVAEEMGISHIIIEEDELDDPRFVENPEDRCYYCRSGLVTALKKLAKEKKINYVLDGANSNDLKGHRPGLRALREQGARSPLLELGFGKKDVRGIARDFGLSTYDKPSMACLASRIPYGEKITHGKLEMVEKAEDFLRGKGFRQVRVRHHHGIARIEVSDAEIEKVTRLRKEISEEFRKLGFKYIALDLEGYRSGSMDEVL
ncbi:MAG: ATP-dependent sacrificial sulfur transferase LarE [Candidatus Hydrothermarchaeales archaeon]